MMLSPIDNMRKQLKPSIELKQQQHCSVDRTVCPCFCLGWLHFGRIYIFGWTKKRHVPVRRDRKKRQESQVRSKSWRGVSNWQQPARASFWNICNDFHPTPQNTILFDRESMTFNNSYQIIILSASASVPIHAVFLQNFPIWCDSFLPLELHSCKVCNHT